MTVKDIEVYNLDVPTTTGTDIPCSTGSDTPTTSGLNCTTTSWHLNKNYQNLYNEEVKKNKYLQEKINELEKIQVNQYRNKGVI